MFASVQRKYCSYLVLLALVLFAFALWMEFRWLNYSTAGGTSTAATSANLGSLDAGTSATLVKVNRQELVDLYNLAEILQPRYIKKFLSSVNIRIAFQFPASCGASFLGIVVLFPACYLDATSWYRRSSECKLCETMFVEHSINRKFLEIGYVTVAVSSPDKGSCFSTNNQADYHIVGALIEKFIQQNAVSGLPVYGVAFGKSAEFLSGFSSFLSSTAKFSFQFKAICLQHANVVNRKLVVPTFFIHSPSFAFVVPLTNGIPFVQRITKTLPIEADYFHQFGIVDQLTSEKLANALSKANVIGENKLLKSDPSTDANALKWQNALKASSFNDMLLTYKKQLQQLLEMAFNKRKMTNQFLDDVVKFFLAHT